MNTHSLCYALCSLIAITFSSGCKTASVQTPSTWTATQQKTAQGFMVPECMVVDSAQGHVYVSNIDATEDTYWADDGKGFISRLSSDGAVRSLRWRDSKKGAEIHAPKGMCILNNYLYYTDNTRVMRLSLSGDGPLVTIPVPGAQKLNDLASDGQNLWVTDTGTGNIHRIDSSGTAHLVANIEAVNGITCHNGKVYAVSWGLHEIFEVPTEDKREPISFNLSEHFTNLDGIEVLDDGSFMVSDFKGNKVSLVSPDRTLVSTLIELESPADIGIDRAKGLLYVPSFTSNTTYVYRLTRTTVSPARSRDR
jgi:sugar lactone lactonase YvrE